jgi:hypothetical protein
VVVEDLEHPILLAAMAVLAVVVVIKAAQVGHLLLETATTAVLAV